MIRQKPKTPLCVWQSGKRLVVVTAWLDGDRPRHDTYEVLAVEAVERFVDDEGAEAEVSHQPLILIDGAIQNLRDAERYYLDGVNELLVADWPEAEDGERLAPVVEQLRRRLALRAEAKKAKAVSR